MAINVKKTMITLLLCIPAVFSYASGNTDNVTFSKVQNRLWKLEEVINGAAVISIERANAPKDIYTIRFQAGRLIGAGADNSYFTSYAIGKKHSLSIGKIGGSRVDPLYEMKNFTEHEYFQCLEKADRWDFRNKKLELHTYDKNGAEIILLFF